MNNLTIIGNVGRDAELRYTREGVPVCDFSVAVNKVTGTGDSRKERTIWFKVTVWRERGETISKYVKKGMKIAVSGEIDVHAYQGKDGPAASLELTANAVEFLSRVESAAPAQDTPPEEISF